ncbi:MAG: hypothetical protein BECKG1743D_GA0114223_105883 [Candidatus Kentron sp. G]|nr:MAG: hypothetical protein BECKG1743D_GA0114223_105883 [Candidatus Kentron sp. G]
MSHIRVTIDVIIDEAVNDPIIREVRNIRFDIERECGSDPGAYYRFLLSAQNDLQDRLVYGRPGKLAPNTRELIDGDVRK